MFYVWSYSKLRNFVHYACFLIVCPQNILNTPLRHQYYTCRRGDRDRMVVGFTTTNVHMQSVPITTDVVGLNLDQGEMYNIM